MRVTESVSQQDSEARTSIRLWPKRGPILLGLEKVFLLLEKPVNRVVGTGLLNPFYAAGPIAVFLLIVLGITGIYVTLFYDFSFARSYESVLRMNRLGVSHFMRAIHRYASDVLILTALLHALRVAMTDRFRRPYWLAWVTGVGLMLLAWLGGVTGYWLIWDQNAHMLTRLLIDAFTRYTPWGEQLAVAIVAMSIRKSSWAFMLSLFVIHLTVFITMGFFVWLHVRRLQRPKYLPRTHWTYITLLALLAVAIVFPAYLLPKADFTRLPRTLRLDLLYLAFIPAALRGLSGWFWAVVTVLTLAVTLLPWITRPPKPKPKVTIDADACTGCHLCALDCPYKAIEMVAREDGPYKHLAVVHHDLCVSCSVCLGSCDDDALEWDGLSARVMAADVRTEVAALRVAYPKERIRIAFACERHADHGAKMYVGGTVRRDDGEPTVIHVKAVRCAGAIHPDVLTAALDAGADEVFVVGCPPDDCAHREGNIWLQERVERRRAPRLDKAYEDAPIYTAWVPPNMFEDVVFGSREGQAWDVLPPASGRAIRVLPPGGWPRVAAAIFLLAVPLIFLIILAHRSFAAYSGDMGMLQVAMEHPVSRLRTGALRAVATGRVTSLRLVVDVDGRRLLDEPIPRQEVRRHKGRSLFREWPVTPGTRHVRVAMVSDDGSLTVTLFQRQITVTSKRAYPLYFIRYGP